MGGVVPFSIVTARVRFDETGASREIPLIVCEQGAVRSVADYCLSMHRSLSWMEKVTRSVKLFCDYLEAHADAPSREENWKVFRNFATCLLDGSIDQDTGMDHSGLYWQPCPHREVGRTVGLLTDLFTWLSRECETNAKTFNPQYFGNAYDKRLDRLAYIHKRSKAFLGYTWLAEGDSRPIHVTARYRMKKKLAERPPKFPDERFAELLFKGFVVAGKPDYRGMLITLLMYGGGLRVSEPFHLYVADVAPGLEDPSIALVTIHHPQDGVAPYGWKNYLGKLGSRAQYLRAEFGLTPRNELRRDAGWKHNAEDGDGYMQVHWFPDILGQWFLTIWKRYLRVLATVDRQHPYAFINLQGPVVGKPYTPKQFSRCFNRAVLRIGLTPKKKLGTTVHGCRHAYAQRLKDSGVDEVNIQRLMHHCSIESQKAYTAPERKEIARALKEAEQELAKRAALPSSLRIEDWLTE